MNRAAALDPRLEELAAEMDCRASIAMAEAAVGDFRAGLITLGDCLGALSHAALMSDRIRIKRWYRFLDETEPSW
jgi:hypothetical protein